MQAMRALGARSVPVVSRGNEFAYAQHIGDVVELLGLDEETGPVLSPASLAERYERVLETAVRLVRQMPDEHLERELPNRPRSWRVLMHHVFQIPVAFLDTEASGETLLREHFVAPPPPDMTTSESIARFGEGVRERFGAWWQGASDGSFERTVPTYYGDAPRHEVLERTVWHSTQHVRQVASLLEQVGIEPDRPLGPADIEGLPLTERIWD